MEDLLLGRIAALVPKFAVKDLPLGRTLMMIILVYLGVDLCDTNGKGFLSSDSKT